MGQDRVKNYLSNYKFQSNNIEFRIVSSKAMEKFKNVQSFQLGQLINGKFFFAQQRRELLLLEYDIVTKWLTEIESSIIAQSKVDINMVVGLAFKSHKKIQETVELYPDKFDTEFTKIYSEMHDYVFNKLLYLIDRLDTSSTYKFYTSLVDLVIASMDHTLIEIHELNNILEVDNNLQRANNGKFILETPPKIYITNISIESFVKHDFSFTKERIAMYKKYFEFDHIIIKNFSNVKIPKEVFENIETIVCIDYKGSVS